MLGREHRDEIAAGLLITFILYASVKKETGSAKFPLQELSLSQLFLNGSNNLQEISHFGSNKLLHYIPDSIQTIENSAFEDCINPKTINIPDSVTRIGSIAFRSCGFKEITIPRTVRVPRNAFWGIHVIRRDVSE